MMTRSPAPSATPAWTVRLRRAAGRLLRAGGASAVGAEARGFDLPIAGCGRRFDMHAQRGRYVLLMFLPPDWCPVCHACLRAYHHEAPLLRRCGVKLVIVTTEASPQLRTFADQVQLEHAIVIDERSVVARRYGATHGPRRARRLLPISLLVDPAGVVRRRSQFDKLSLCVSDVAAILEADARSTMDA